MTHDMLRTPAVS